MSTLGTVHFDSTVPGLRSPAPSPSFRFDLAGSDDGLSEKERFYYEPKRTQYRKSTPWTSRPQSLRERLRPRWWRDIIVDSVSLLMPLPFFFLSAIVLFLNEHEVKDWVLSALETSIKGATTLYPIFFAGLTGRAAIKFATWKLEQGSSLGLLEQLMGSRTVISTITTQVRLRTFNLIGLGLIVLWLLSPLGSQAILNMLQSPLVPITSNTGVTYFNTRAQSYSSPTGPFRNTWYSGFTMLFGASLLAPASIKLSSMDLWGNVKIPYYSSVLRANSTVDNEGWTTLPKDFYPTYTSLFGIPMSELSFGNTTLTMESSYVALECGNKTVANVSNGGIQLEKNTLISPAGPFLSNDPVSTTAAWAIGYQGPDIAQFNETFFNSNISYPYTYPQSCPDCLPNDIPVGNIDPGTLLYQEFDVLDNVTSIYCTPSQVYIESSIFCESTLASTNCRVLAQRPSQLTHKPTTITTLSFRRVILGLTSLLPNSTPQYTLTSPIQSYLYDPLSSTSILSGTNSIGLIGGDSPIHSLPMDDFSLRLGQILNTYLHASIWNATAYITGEPLNSLTSVLLGGNSPSLTPSTPTSLSLLLQNRASTLTVPAMLTTPIRIYRVSYPWIALFIFATVAMTFSAISGVLFSRNTVVPDYLGYVSTLAKESPHVRMPNGGANLDGMDRARLMKDLRVRLGDVEEGGQVGRLAFARAEETAVVRKDSFYV